MDHSWAAFLARLPTHRNVSLSRYRAASRLVGALPEPVIRNVGRVGGRLAYLRAGRRRAMADRHMQRVGGTGAQLYEGYGRYWAELLWLSADKADRVEAAITHEGLDHVIAARDAGNGMIYALPHIGNWEVAGLLARQIGVQVVAVAEDLPDNEVTRWFVEKRRALALDIEIADGNPELVTRLRARLARGDAVALLCDRDVTGAGVPVEFFGETAPMPSGPALLAIRTGAPILPVAAFFRRGRGHHIVVRPPVEVSETGRLSDRVEETTRRVAAELEILIRRDPAQWHVVQPLWPSDHAFWRGETL